jgi:hypothetical protein
MKYDLPAYSSTKKIKTSGPTTKKLSPKESASDAKKGK